MPNVTEMILNLKATWNDANAFEKQAKILAEAFIINFEKFKDVASYDVLEGSPHQNKLVVLRLFE